MKKKIKIVIATRNSELALWQAVYVKKRLEENQRDITVELLPLTTTGDKFLDTALTKIGGKGLFTKELENALYDKRADIAVHSVKDLPFALPDGLCLAAVCARANPCDALITTKVNRLEDLSKGAIVGTSSLRRQCQLLTLRDDMQIKTLRGNVNTRLKKLIAGEYDAIILAHAGLERLGLQSHITETLDPTIMLPAAGQGALGIECREDDEEIKAYLQNINDDNTLTCITAERVVSRELGGNCHVPLAAHAQIIDNSLWLRALVGTPDGKTILRADVKGDISETESVGKAAAQKLLTQGAQAILQDVE